LDKLDEGKTKGKRDVRSNYGFLEDELTEANKIARSPKIKANYDVKSSGSEIEVPLRNGSPAFSIHASKVYILYPSLFQDPNIFGRFTIPQNINLDPVPDKKPEFSDYIPPEATKPLANPPPPKAINSNPYSPYQSNRNRRARHVEGPPSDTANAKDEADKKRNVESHLTGTIVVLNQDVNEINRKDAY
jgi:hypothetical protein